MKNSHIDSSSKLLPAYCHYPISWARNEHNSSKKDHCKITTINWTYVKSRQTGKVDHRYVRKNVYEIPLAEIKQWIADCDEEIVSIEKVSE